MSRDAPCSSGSMAVDEKGIGQLLESGINIHGISREEKYHILTSKPHPDPSCYPRTRPHSLGAFCQFHPAWMRQYPWLHYSNHVDGAFCRACIFFASEKVGGHTPGQFVTKSFKVWVKRCEKMDAHA